ncbi:MAG TPA: dihydrolipoamide acetyltransferase family protein [Acidimicrobiales bacterium]|nr:dihydrolipoamide acetyltransferase family protein [Acidimicrobiales bacterium]
MADVTMPQLGETVTEGTITKWFKKVGDPVAVDEPLFEVSTDKVDTEVPSPTAGFLAEIKVNEGDTVDVGALIAVISEEAGAAPAPPAAAPAPEPVPAPAPDPVVAPVVAPAPVAAAEPIPAAAATPAPAAAPVAAAAAPSGPNGKLLSPVVRRLVAEHGLDPSSITGTGAGGRITREDVLDHIDKVGGAPPAPPAAVPAAPAAAPVAPAAPAPVAAAPAPAAAPPAVAVQAGQRDEVVTLPKIRKLTGDHMVMSLATSPHSFSVVEVDYENVDRVRRVHMDAWRGQEGFMLTYLPFISRAVIDAIAEFPRMNAAVGDGELTVHHFVDLGIAVDLNYEGLLVPVIRDADTKRLRAIAREIYDLATRARSRKLSPDEIRGGTFTISNNGSAGSVLTAAIINQPQVAIISTDAIKRRPVVVEATGGGEAIVIHSVGNLAMSWDHRAFGGVYAAHFLVKIKEILETRDWEAEL